MGVAPNSEVNQKQRAIQLECRNRTLDIRDRLLDGVRPERTRRNRIVGRESEERDRNQRAET